LAIKAMRFIATLVFLKVESGLANWLLQCSSCVDQAYFGDMSLKDNIMDADLSVMLAKLKQIRLREFDHREDEFYNKFFSKRQLGIVTQELQSVMPEAVATVPERRWTNSKGTSMSTKNVMLLRDSHLLMVTVGSVQLLARKSEFWDSSIAKLDKSMVTVIKEQDDNRRKREEMLEQIVRIIARTEVMQHTLGKTEEGFVRLNDDVSKLIVEHKETFDTLSSLVQGVSNRTIAQDARIASFQDEFRAAVDREARADLVEKRRSSEADLEVALVKRSIEKLKWEEEQKTVVLREEEKRTTEGHSTKLHQARVAYELEQKRIADLAVMHEQEESNLRQEEARVAGEKQLLYLRLESEEKRAELDVQKAIEASKIEAEAKIRERRENEDVHMRQMRAEMQEKRQQMLAAIRATAEIVASWIASLYSSPQNLMLAIGSIVLAMGGVYLCREMAILLREQLNKRLGRPSLVRSTNRRGMCQQIWIGLLRLLRLRGKHGSEFDDVVLHPHLRKQVMRLAEATRSAKKRNMPLMHVMFYGPPGTGKTMVAQRFAEYSGLEYAIMSGGDVAPLQEEAVTELHKLFKWVHRSKKGVLLFIDEADAFLASRKGSNMSEALRNALTTMLYHTGTPSSQFMMVLATNRPDDLDAAALDRIDESVEFGLPGYDARKGMVQLYFEKYVAKPLKIQIAKPKGSCTLAQKTKSGRRCCKSRAEAAPNEEFRIEDFTQDEDLSEVARQIDGFSGREISKLFTALQTHVLYNDSNQLDKLRFLSKEQLFEVVQQKVVEHTRTREFQVSGYDYVHTEEKSKVHVTPEPTMAQPEPHIAQPQEAPQQLSGKNTPVFDLTLNDDVIGATSALSLKGVPTSPIMHTSMGFVPTQVAA